MDRAAVIKKLFELCDDDHDGMVSTAEFKQLTQDPKGRFVTGFNVSEQWTTVFKRIDANSDGVLSEDEFVGAIIEMGTDVADEDFAEQTDEWLRLAKERVVLPPEGSDRAGKLRQVFYFLDDDQDGKVTVEEFKQLTFDPAASYVLSIDGNTSVQWSTLFMRTDANWDGVLSEEEFVKANLEGATFLSDAVFDEQVETWLQLAKNKVVLSPS